MCLSPARKHDKALSIMGGGGRVRSWSWIQIKKFPSFCLCYRNKSSCCLSCFVACEGNFLWNCLCFPVQPCIIQVNLSSMRKINLRQTMGSEKCMIRQRRLLQAWSGVQDTWWKLAVSFQYLQVQADPWYGKKDKMCKNQEGTFVFLSKSRSTQTCHQDRILRKQYF